MNNKEEIEKSTKLLILELMTIIDKYMDLDYTGKERGVIVSSALSYVLGAFIDSVIKDELFNSKVRLLNDVYNQSLQMIHNHNDKKKKAN